MSATESKDKHRSEDRFLDNGKELEVFVEKWRECMLSKAAWTHAAHVAVAAYHAFDHGPDELFSIMKRGIIELNGFHGTVDGPDSGYHETLTRFWSLLIGNFTRENRFPSRLEAVRRAVDLFGPQRDLHKRYYSFDVARDRRARQEWIAPDTSELLMRGSSRS